MAAGTAEAPGHRLLARGGVTPTWRPRPCAGSASCGAPARRPRCPACGSPRVLSHPELRSLSIAHLDCDAFYASVEKRDDPSLLDKPVIVGGRHRGVVSAACYVARIYGVRSAMPMFKALDACPHAVVIKPDMKKYAAVGGEIREMMRSITPQVEPLSIDEAFMDLSGTERLHRAPPAETLARLAKHVEETIRVTVSIGLSYNKFLAKVASDLDKPRGFHVIGQAEAIRFLAEQPVSILWGVGKTLQRKLIADGIRTIGDLQPFEETELMRRYGSIGQRLARFSQGRDNRRIEPGSVVKSVSNETTFDADISDVDVLAPLSVATERGSVGAAEAQGDRRRCGHAQAEDLRVQDPHPAATPDGADTDGRPHLPHRRRAARQAGRRTAIPADRGGGSAIWPANGWRIRRISPIPASRRDVRWKAPWTRCGPSLAMPRSPRESA